jgi:ribosomal protein S18 acetylase RimI-like enzyme
MIVSHEFRTPSGRSLVTATPRPNYYRLVSIDADELRGRIREALLLYVHAMGYSEWTAEQRAPMWLSHMLRAGWRCVGALNGREELVGIGYGYVGAPGQWWHEQVRRGLVQAEGRGVAEHWMNDYFELTELHVRPDAQGGGIGERLLHNLLAEVSASRVLLSTPEGESRAWRLYRRLGFADVLRHHIFNGDARPFAVLGRDLPLPG